MQGGRAVVWAALVSGAVLWGHPLRAQDTAGRVQLSLEQYVYLHESVKVTPETGPSDTTDHSAFGLVPSAFGLGAAYAIDSSVLIGGKLAFSNDHTDTGDTATMSLLPFVELSLGTSSVQPTLAVVGGYRTYTEEPDQGQKLESRAFAIGGSGGVRLFASRDFTIGPFVQVLLQTGSGEVGSQEAKFNSFAVMAGVSFAGWLGEPRAATLAGPAFPGEDDVAAAPSVDPAHEDVETYAVGPAPKVSDDGTVEIRFPVMGGGALRLRGHPGKDAAAVSLELSVSERGERFANCVQLALETGEATVPLESVEHAEPGEGATAVLRAKVQIAALSVFGRAAQTAVVACDDDFKLEAGHRRHVLRFIDVFQARSSR